MNDAKVQKPSRKRTKADVSFNQWMLHVDNVLLSDVGLPSSDLIDVDWADEYDSGSTVEGAIDNLADDLEIDDVWSQSKNTKEK